MFEKDKVEEIFADGVSQVSYSEVFRIIFGRIDPQAGNNDQGIPLIPNATVIMTVNGLLQLKKAIGEVIDQMVDAGVLDKDAVAAATAPQQAQGGTAPQVAPSTQGTPSSSNFE